MRTFEHFPKERKCGLCGTNKDGRWMLVGVDGTGDGNLEEGIPTHVDCIKLRYNPEIGVFYQRTMNFKKG